jgi:Fatty acid desaturase
MNFDIDRYLGLVAPLDDSDIDYDAFLDRPLDANTLRCLRYMHDVEFHTTCYLRDLLVTSAHDDPEITTFLAMWSFEEYWHGEAIAKVLARHDEVHGRERIAATRRRVGRERLKTLSMMLGSAITDHVVAVALVWGAVNEWTTQAGYVQLAKRSGHPVLAELLGRIAKQEGRHIDFYVSQASRRLDESPMARRLTRLTLRHRWRPVGAGVMPAVETDYLIGHLFGGDDGASLALRIDRRVGRLPGLHALALVTAARSASLAA